MLDVAGTPSLQAAESIDHLFGPGVPQVGNDAGRRRFLQYRDHVTFSGWCADVSISASEIVAVKAGHIAASLPRHTQDVSCLSTAGVS